MRKERRYSRKTGTKGGGGCVMESETLRRESEYTPLGKGLKGWIGQGKRKFGESAAVLQRL
jgi:hypothetical protein